MAGAETAVVLCVRARGHVRQISFAAAPSATKVTRGRLCAEGFTPLVVGKVRA
jgi:hypothetical protein